MRFDCYFSDVIFPPKPFKNQDSQTPYQTLSSLMKGQDSPMLEVKDRFRLLPRDNVYGL